MKRIMTIALILALFLAGEGAVDEARAGAEQSCAADCDGDQGVVINELIRCVNVALGSAALATCEACDTSGDGGVAINELIAAVGAALGGCPPPAMPTPTGTFGAATATLTPAVTATAEATP